MDKIISHLTTKIEVYGKVVCKFCDGPVGLVYSTNFIDWPNKKCYNVMGDFIWEKTDAPYNYDLDY
jgi:hypothetical protein